MDALKFDWRPIDLFFTHQSVKASSWKPSRGQAADFLLEAETRVSRQTYHAIPANVRSADDGALDGWTPARATTYR